jgi:transposase
MDGGRNRQIYVNPRRAEIRYGYGMTRAPLKHVSISAEELAALIAERDAVLAECDALRSELRVTKVERDLLKEQLKAFECRLFGAKSEARNLFLNEAEALAPTAATLPAHEEEAETQVGGHKGKKPGQPLDPALQREVIRYELPKLQESARIAAAARTAGRLARAEAGAADF